MSVLSGFEACNFRVSLFTLQSLLIIQGSLLYTASFPSGQCNQFPP